MEFYQKEPLMQEKEIRYQNKKLFYRVSGQGSPVVVFIHGFPENGSIWQKQIEALTGFTLIVPDLPGSGRSEAIKDMTMEGLAEAIKYLLDAEVASPGGSPSHKVVPIGHSMGGYIALAFAEKYPEWLSGIGLFHSTAYADSAEKIEARKKGIEFIRRNGPQEFLKNTIKNLYAPETREKNPGLIEEQIRAAYNFSGDVLVSYYEGMMKRPDRTQVLKQSKVPVLFILGKWDTAVPLEDGLKIGHLPEISYIDILEHSAHMGMLEETSKANEIINHFLHFIEKSESDQ